MEHTLADEIQSYVIDPARVSHLMEGALELVDALHDTNKIHTNLHPKNFLVDKNDRLAITYQPIVDPKYAPAERELVPASNVYTMGVILRELLANRPDITPSAVELIERATRTAPSARLSIRAMRDANEALALGSPAYGRWLEAFAPTDERERELVVAARSDRDARLVYADWLEQNGFEARAKFIRDETPGPPDEATWRALVSSATIIGCVQPTCGKRWDLLEPLPFDNIRRCPGCTRPVFYCATVEEVMVYARRGHAVAPDASISRQAAITAYDLVPRYQPHYPPITGNPPAPRSYVEGAPPRDNVFTRLFGLFRRR